MYGSFVATSNGQTTGLGAGTDVGSPGYAPEPTTFAVLALGSMLGLARRR